MSELKEQRIVAAKVVSDIGWDKIILNVEDLI